MKRALGWVAAFVLLAVPARAGDGMGVSVGYSFLKYLEDGGGDAPLGFYLSLAGRGKSALEVDLAYHRDTGQLVLGDVIFDTTLQTFTGQAGFKVGPAPRYGQTGGARPYFHLLGGVRRDWLSTVGSETESNTAWGGMTGLGVDIKMGQGFAIRLAADFQMFWDEGESLKTLRLSPISWLRGNRAVRPGSR
jgi:hypothetical protein